MVRRVREMLRFQAKCEAWFVDAALLAGDRSIKVVPGVELHSRFGREHPQNPASSRLIYLGRLGQLALAR